MKPEGPMPHSQRFFNNSYSEPNPCTDSYLFKIYFNIVQHLLLGFPIGLSVVGLLVKIFKAFLPSSILAKCPARLNLLDLITLTILGKRYKVPHCGKPSNRCWTILK